MGRGRGREGKGRGRGRMGNFLVYTRNVSVFLDVTTPSPEYCAKQNIPHPRTYSATIGV